jgi:hypothetical protein
MKKKKFRDLKLHIKLGLVKNFVKVLNRNSNGFLCLKEKFPKVTDTKIKVGIFVCLQIKNW